MAVSISESLEAHQAGARTLPALRVRVERTRGGWDILEWARDYTGAEEVGGPHAAVLTAAGALVRARSEDDGAYYVRRVAGPEPGATWNTSETTLTANGKNGGDLFQSVQLAAKSGEVIAVAQHIASEPFSYRAQSSTDDGATWGTAVTVGEAEEAVGSVAVEFNGAGNPVIFYGTGRTRMQTRVSGVWGTPAEPMADGTWARITGRSVRRYQGDFVMLASGELVDGRWAVAAYIIGDTDLPSGTLFGPRLVVEADAEAGVEFRGAHLALVGGKLVGSWSAVQTADVEDVRPWYSYPPAGDLALQEWREPLPFDAAGEGHGLGLAADGSYVYATSPDGVWAAGRAGAAVDVSGRVVKATATAEPDGGRLTVELAGLGEVPDLVEGGLVELSVGYLSGEEEGARVAEYGAKLGYVVRRVRREWVKGEGRLVVEGHSLWEEFEGLRLSTGWRVAGGVSTRAGLFGRLAGRAGWGAATEGSTSDAWTAYSPGFAVLANETVAQAIRRLMAPVSDHARADRGRDVVVTGLAADDTEDWTLGPGAQPVEAAVAVSERPRSAWERVQGDGVVADRYDFGALARGGGFRYYRSVEVGDEPAAEDWVDGLRRRAEVSELALQVVIPAHAGIELYDVVEATVPALGIEGELYRVRELELVLDRGRTGRYAHRLGLGVV